MQLTGLVGYTVNKRDAPSKTGCITLSFPLFSQKRGMMQKLADARHASLTNTEQALSMLIQLKTAITDKNIIVEPGLMAEIEADIKYYKTGEEGTPADAGGDDDGLDDGLDDDL